jgi:hypothetical protein
MTIHHFVFHKVYRGGGRGGFWRRPEAGKKFTASPLFTIEDPRLFFITLRLQFFPLKSSPVKILYNLICAEILSRLKPRLTKGSPILKT